MGVSIAICGLALMGVSILFLFLFRRARVGALPVNHATGLRTKAIMSSTDVWTAVHRKYAWVLMAPGAGFFLAGLWLVSAAAIPALSPVVMPVFCALFGTMLVVLVIGGISADKYARSIRSQGDTP